MVSTFIHTCPDTERVVDLRRRVRAAMERPPVPWTCPARIDDRFLSEPLPVRKSRAIALKLSHMPADLWEGQVFAGSMTLETPRLHTEWRHRQTCAAARPGRDPQGTRIQNSSDGAYRGLRSCSGSPHSERHTAGELPLLYSQGLGNYGS